MTSQPSASVVSHRVRVHLKDVQDREFLPQRVIILEPPLYEIRIGRGSQTDACLHPSHFNAWFTSRVMSREHALLKADPLSKKLFLEDTASMHGTYLDNLRLEPNQPVLVRNEEKIQFGTQIIRGDQIYNPLELSMNVTWEDRRIDSQPDAHPNASPKSKNTFSVDYSDEDDNDYDDEIRFLRRQPRRYTVPESDDDESSTGDKETAVDSAPSSPTELADSILKMSATSSIPQPTHPVATELIGELLRAAPGSTLQNAFDLSDDEDQGGVTRKNPIEEHDTISIYSEDETPDLVNEADMDEEAEEVEEEEEEEASEEQDLNHSIFHCGSDGEEVCDENRPPPGLIETEMQGEAHDRAPSPSDAAMPKPTCTAPNSLPAIHSLVDSTPAQPLRAYDYTMMSGTQPLPNVSPFSFYNMNYASNTGNLSYSTLYDNEFGAPVSMPQLSQYDPYGSRPYYSQIHGRPGSGPSHMDTLSMDVRDPEPTKPSKVSIHDIIDEVQPNISSTGISRKRKADQISATVPTTEEFNATDAEHMDSMTCLQVSPSRAVNSEPYKVALDAPQTPTELQADFDTNSEKCTPSKKSVTFSPQAVIINPVPERPRKKIKVDHGQQRNSFFKYFAATVAGATLGAVGTVFGLAALPADYFI